MKTKPSKYTPELIAKAKKYLTKWEDLGDVIPMLCSMAEYLDISLSTLYSWEKEAKEGDESKAEILEVCARVRQAQEKVLINKGLSRVSDASLSKLLLMKHGYSDRQDVNVQSEDGSMSPITAKEAKEALDAKLKDLGIERRQ